MWNGATRLGGGRGLMAQTHYYCFPGALFYLEMRLRMESPTRLAVSPSFSCTVGLRGMGFLAGAGLLLEGFAGALGFALDVLFFEALVLGLVFLGGLEGTFDAAGDFFSAVVVGAVEGTARLMVSSAVTV